MSCQYHPALEDWPTENLENHICPKCGEENVHFNSAMAKRIIGTRLRTKKPHEKSASKGKRKIRDREVKP
jgi:hypothetical protein